jgi:hypothetical protein
MNECYQMRPTIIVGTERETDAPQVEPAASEAGKQAARTEEYGTYIAGSRTAVPRHLGT